MTPSDHTDQQTKDAWHADPKNWKLGLFYFNPEDKRILPPKRIKWLGWTINFANPWSVLTLILMLLALVFLLS